VIGGLGRDHAVPRSGRAAVPGGRRPVPARACSESRRSAGALAVTALALVLAGCAGVPSASAPRVIEPVPKGGLTDEPDVRFQPISPRPGGSAVSIVQDFLAASESPERQHGIARQFLTPPAAKSWRDNEGAVVLDSRPSYVEARNGGSEVTIRTRLVGRLDSAGSYTPLSESYSQRFLLDRINGEWRISDPPPGVIVTATGFEQTYRRLNVYFLDQSGSKVVPDPRWYTAPRESLPNALLSALLGGPSSALSGAVRSELTGGVSLTSNVVPDANTVRVYLSGLGTLDQAARRGASAQIVWTLSQLGAPGVEIFDDNEPLRLRGRETVQHVGDWGAYDPDDLPLSASGYFVRAGVVWTTDGRRATIPTGDLRAVSVGVSRDLRRVAVVSQSNGRDRIYVGPVAGPLRPGPVAESLSPPTWGAAADEVWTVRNRRQILRVSAKGAASSVSAPDLESYGEVSVMRLSPDGTRVAIIAGIEGAGRLYVGTVSRAGRPTIDRLTPIAPGLTNATDLAWSAADSLIVLTRGGGSDAVLQSVAVDGSVAELLTTSGLPGPPSAVAAASTLPRLTVAESGVWRLRDPQEAWTAVPPNPGQDESAPAYPG
jgi:hypothetical protein